MGKSTVEVTEEWHMAVVENSEAISSVNIGSEGIIIKSERIDLEGEKVITEV